jgi:hypothetical protein
MGSIRHAIYLAERYLYWLLETRRIAELCSTRPSIPSKSPHKKCFHAPTPDFPPAPLCQTTRCHINFLNQPSHHAHRHHSHGKTSSFADFPLCTLTFGSGCRSWPSRSYRDACRSNSSPSLRSVNGILTTKTQRKPHFASQGHPTVQSRCILSPCHNAGRPRYSDSAAFAAAEKTRTSCISSAAHGAQPHPKARETTVKTKGTGANGKNTRTKMVIARTYMTMQQAFSNFLNSIPNRSGPCSP